MDSQIDQYLDETIKIAQSVDRKSIGQMVESLKDLKSRHGRLFILGVGGSAANASHAVNDFRKICDIETYAPTDNVAELTARTNDESWETVFSHWLATSKLSSNDCVLVFSVGGGSKTASLNLVRAMEYAREKKAKVLSIVSRNGGAAKELSDVCTLIPVVNEKLITPHAEGWQGVVWHMVVSILSSSDKATV
jgi:D-sedoheptulose 7-phosphate isomerase